MAKMRRLRHLPASLRVPSPSRSAWACWTGGLFAALGLAGAHATAVHRCTDAQGHISYSEAPCPAGGQTRVLALETSPPDAGDAPEKPHISFSYDPKGAPAAWTPVRMGGAIRRAGQAWMQGCPVRLTYFGEEPAERSALAGRLSVRWSAGMVSPHVGAGAWVAGRGGPDFGIALSPRLSERQIDRVLTHEMGHVLGLPHVHDDPLSVMSYLPDRDVQDSATPAGRDLALCAQLIRARFGAPEQQRTALQALQARPAPSISDAEAVRRSQQAGRR